MPLFSRKSSTASTRKASTGSERHDGIPPENNGDNASNAQQQRKPNKLSRSGSGFSMKSSVSDVKASDLVGRFTRSHNTPASRRVPSFTSTSLESSVSDVGALDTSTTSLSAASNASFKGSQENISNVPTALSMKSLTSTSGTTIPVDLRHRGDTEVDPEPSSDDEAYESPEEFVDAEETISPTTQVFQGISDSSLVASSSAFTPDDAAKLAVPVTADTALQADLRQVWYAINLFLNSHFTEAQAICTKHKEDRMYYALGSATLNSIKGLMSFEPDELAVAVEECKRCLAIADKERNNWPTSGSRGLSWSEKIAGGFGAVARGSSLTVEITQRMSVLQRHAELAYAECLLIKAITSLMYAGDFVAFIKESLNMRTSHAIYKVLRRYIQVVDAAHPTKHDPTIDHDFRSGVDFGIGCSSLILSLLPSTAVKIVELFGFSGNREEALDILMKTGGWTKGGNEPFLKEGPGNEGLRRPVCDLVLLAYHLIISSIIPTQDVDIDLAERILQYNLARFPDGVFFLYFSGRLFSTQTRASRAIEQYHKALTVQSNAGASFKQIQHIVQWDLSLTHLSLGDYIHANESLNILAKESNWSKAVYSYGHAVTMYENLLRESANSADEQADASIRKLQVREIMKTIPGFVQRIAGKSLPFEKFVARKSKKFLAQDDSLVLPGLELSYMLSCLSLATRQAIVQVHLPEVAATLAQLEAIKAKEEGALPAGWWDDYCLAHFLQGVLLHYFYRPDPQVKAEPFEPSMSAEEADKAMVESLNMGIINSTKLELDHHVAYLCHVELARLLIKLGPEHYVDARQHLDMVLHGTVPFGPTKGKGKVSMQNAFVLKANGILEQLNAQTKD